ncbi:lipoprotein [Spiroplasma endosymbiont of Ammophila pubescens]|uniref:lipoprotein n=1 Tax=Spiroplasma endosymbiont of Ammophila pubescens TaxID=3066315 RepID=UPI0032B254EF
MKKLLSILGTIGLTATSTTNLVACDKPKPNNNSENGNNKPEPQQPPKNSNWKLFNNFNWLKNNFDNKYYFVIWKHYNEKEWEIKKFKHNSKYDMGIQTYINNNNFKGLYRWDNISEPQIPTINKNTGEITDWKG